jgi:hypothetical protein
VTADEKAEKRSVGSQLVDMARAIYDLGVSDDGTPFGSWGDVPHVALPLRGGKLGLRAGLARRFFEKHNTVPAAQALADACMVLEGFAAQEPAQRLHLRVGGHNGVVYIDTADRQDRVIAIRGGQWGFTDKVPVVFRRTELTAPMPDPVPGGDLSQLWDFVNVAQADRPVLLAFMVAALVQPDAPHPILGLLAEHGSAKSTTTRFLVSLIDPSTAPLRMAPRDADQWVTAASGSWVVALDNLSGIPDWLSDALCRAATGDANIKRQLYTDSGLSVIKFRRCGIVNGIDLGGLNGDLAYRLALADLERINDTDRRDETELEAGWQAARPAILGALLDLAAQVHHRLPTIKVERSPRMADFAKVLAAVDEIHNTNGLKRYRDRATHLAADSIAADLFIARLQDINYTGTDVSAAEILRAATPADKDWRAPQGWPKKPRVVTTQLTRHAPALRAVGWHIENDSGQNKAKATRWTIKPPDQSRNPDPPNPPIPAGGLDGREAGYDNSPNPPKNTALTSEDGLAGQAGHKYGPSLVSTYACRFCGAELKYSSARSRGHCSSATCLAAAREQTGGR